MIITIQKLLEAHGLNPKAKIKLVRHKDARERRKDGHRDICDMYRFNKTEFEDYQAIQSKPRFHNVDYIVSFIGEKGSKSRFVGVYHVAGVKSIDETKKRSCPEDKYFYILEEIPGFEELKERVIIRWKNARKWEQWYKNEMEVIEINQGFEGKPFTDYLDFILSFDELSVLVKEDNEEWKRMLSSVYGVYVIRDTKAEKLYIGSACGKNGVWQRWSEYVETGGHGGNITLKALISKDPDYAKNFNFSLLMIMSKSKTRDEVNWQEQLLKNKLGAEYCNN